MPRFNSVSAGQTQSARAVRDLCGATGITFQTAPAIGANCYVSLDTLPSVMTALAAALEQNGYYNSKQIIQRSRVFFFSPLDLIKIIS